MTTTADKKRKYKSEWAKRKYREDPEKYKIKARKYGRIRIKNHPWWYLLRNAQVRAKRFGVPFDLTDSWCAKRWIGKCEITGIPFLVSDGGPGMFSASIDRVRPTLGYTQDNCRFILLSVNALKSSGTDDDMRMIASRIVSSNYGEFR